jgi:hypothetical protein
MLINMRALTIKASVLRLRKVMKPLSAKFLSGVAIATTVLLSSCKKDTSDIGLDLLQGDQLHGMFTDTLTVISHTRKVDSVKTSKTASIICGNYYDPVFGVTNASFYSELYPEKTGTSVDFGPDPQIDSIVLSLAYKGYYGRPAPLTFKVFQVTQRMYADSSYNSDTSLTYNSLFPLANVTLEPNTIDSVHADGLTYPPQLRMDKVLLSGLLNESIYTTLDDFLDIFSGILVTASPTSLSGNRALYYFNPSDARTKVTLYYHDASTPSTQVKFAYLMGGSSQRFNHFDHDYTLAPNITAQVNSPEFIQEDLVYAQGLAGLQVKLSIPYLMQLKAGGDIAINKAELVVKADPGTIDNFFTPPTQLVVVALDSVGNYTTTPDLLEGQSYSGGTYDASAKAYRFNIGRYLQGVLNGSITDRGLMIIVSGGAIFANRVVLGGGGPNSAYRMKLNIIYTKL